MSYMATGGGPLDGQRLVVPPSRSWHRVLDLERVEVHVYELEDGDLVYRGCWPEVEFLRNRVAELEGAAT